MRVDGPIKGELVPGQGVSTRRKRFNTVYKYEFRRGSLIYIHDSRNTKSYGSTFMAVIFKWCHRDVYGF